MTLTYVHYAHYAECAPATLDALAADTDVLLVLAGHATIGIAGLKAELGWPDHSSDTIGHGQAHRALGNGVTIAFGVGANFGCIAYLIECHATQNDWAAWIEARRRECRAKLRKAESHVSLVFVDGASLPRTEVGMHAKVQRILADLRFASAPIAFAADMRLGLGRVGDLWVLIAKTGEASTAKFLLNFEVGYLPASLLGEFAVHHEAARIREVVHNIEEANRQPFQTSQSEAFWENECRARLEAARANAAIAHALKLLPPGGEWLRAIDEQIELAKESVARLETLQRMERPIIGVSSSQPHPAKEDNMKVAEALARLFNAAERRVLLRRLSVNPEDIILHPRTADEEAWAIIDWFTNRGRANELMAAVVAERPQAMGNDVSTSTTALPVVPSAPHLAHVLIITALKEEYDEARKVDAGALDTWTVDTSLTGFEVAFRTYNTQNNQRLRIALTWATRMRTTATAEAAGRLLDKLGAGCLAMSGVCAGRRGKVYPGDVIVGSLLYTYDTGATRAEYDEEGNRRERFQAEPNPYPLEDQWLHRAQAFKPFVDAPPTWLTNRPSTLAAQGDWLMARLHAGEKPEAAPDVEQRCPSWAGAIERLRKLKFVTEGVPLTLTPEGKAHIENLLLLNRGALPSTPSWRIHVAPIATGNNVMRDPRLFDRLSDSMRDVLGVEMEAAAIAAVAHARQLRWFVMKGVMDHADYDKDDSVKTFAARASAECLLEFLRTHLVTTDGRIPTSAEDNSQDALVLRIEGPDIERHIVVYPGQVVVIGRTVREESGQKLGIAVPADNEMSKAHAEFHYECAGRLHVRDLNTKNGTRVMAASSTQDVRGEKLALSGGDRVLCGATLIQVIVPETKEKTPAATDVATKDAS